MEIQQSSYLFWLPLEIRQQIYFLASPPRLVHLQEHLDQDWEDFLQETRTVPGRLKPDPSLTHFAFNWSTRITPGRQRQLQSFGFTTNKTLRHPWPVSASTPEIPCEWLEERPVIAWEIGRKSHFSSNAAIPPLLHVSRHARAEMMSLGYRLFFRTRSSQPRTWFNVNYDILFAENLARDRDSNHRFLSGCDWDFGQFDPDEMKLVQRLALQDSSFYFGATGPVLDDWELTTVLRLFPGLSELLLLGWIEKNRGTGKPLVPGGKSARRDKRGSDPWVISPSQEIDCLFTIFPTETNWCSGTWAGGNHGEVLTTYMKEHGHDARYFADTSLSMQRELTQIMENIIMEQKDATLARWNIPRFTAAQAVPSSWVERQGEERLKLRRILRGLQQEWKLAKESQQNLGTYFSEDSFFEVKFASLHWARLALRTCIYCEEYCREGTRFREIKRWWIEKGPQM